MEHMYLWGIMQSGQLLVLGPYEGERDREYLRRLNIIVANGVKPHIRWLSTIDQNVATSIIKHQVMGVEESLQLGTARARHDIDRSKINVNQSDTGGDTICGG